VTPRGFEWRAANALVQGHTGEARPSTRRPAVGFSSLRGSDAGESNAQILAGELKSDLAQMFDLSYEPKWDLYAEDVLFTDPLNKFTGIQKYKDNIKMLKDSPLFTAGKMDLHEVKVVDDTRVDTRWTLQMTFKPFPWRPRLLFTGTTKYIMNEDGLVVKHLDEWDSLSNNQPVSFEAVLELVSQMLPDIAGLVGLLPLPILFCPRIPPSFLPLPLLAHMCVSSSEEGTKEVACTFKCAQAPFGCAAAEPRALSFARCCTGGVGDRSCLFPPRSCTRKHGKRRGLGARRRKGFSPDATARHPKF